MQRVKEWEKQKERQDAAYHKEQRDGEEALRSIGLLRHVRPSPLPIVVRC